MNRKKNIIALFSFLFLSGCSVFPGQKPADVSDQAPAVVTDEAQQAEQIRPLSCDMLRDSAMKDNCKNEVNQTIAQALQAEISHTFDAARCAELAGYDEGRCKQAIEATGVVGPVTLADYDALKEALRPSRAETLDEGEAPFTETTTSGVARCDSVATPLKQYCQNEMNKQIQEDLLFEIIASKNSNRCSELTVQELKDQCEQEFGTFVEPQAEANPEQGPEAAMPAGLPEGTPVDDAVMDADTSALPSLFPNAGFKDTKAE